MLVVWVSRARAGVAGADSGSPALAAFDGRLARPQARAHTRTHTHTQLLGIRARRREIVAMLAEVDRDGSGEVWLCVVRVDVSSAQLGLCAEGRPSSSSNP